MESPECCINDTAFQGYRTPPLFMHTAAVQRGGGCVPISPLTNSILYPTN